MEEQLAKMSNDEDNLMDAVKAVVGMLFVWFLSLKIDQSLTKKTLHSFFCSLMQSLLFWLLLVVAVLVQNN